MTASLVAGLEVGRDAAAGLALNDSSVSRRHVRVSAGADGLVLENLSSNNGLFIDGAAVPPGTSRPLGGARRVQIGGLLFEVRLDDTTRPVNEPLTIGTADGAAGPAPIYRIVTDGDACTVQLRGHHLDVSVNAARALRAMAKAPGTVVHEWDIQTEVGGRINVAQLMSSIRRAFKAAIAQKRLREDEIRTHIEAARVGSDLESVTSLSGAALLRRYVWARRGHGYAWMVPERLVTLDEP
jgi:hypothetical protein